MSKLELGFITKNYEIVRAPDGSQLRTHKHLDKYIELFPEAAKQNIWYDLKLKKYFSQAHYRGTHAGKGHHFLCQPDLFLKSGWGLRPSQIIANDWELCNPDQPGADQCTWNNEIIFGNHARLSSNEENSDKSVLVICGGPSVNSVSWENLNYDKIWSCNQFFMNEKVAKHKVDLITIIADLFDYENDPEFLKYFEENKPLVSFEIERGDSETWPPFGTDEYLKTKRFCKTHPENTTFFHTRYRGQLGVGVRLIVYAIMAGFKDVYIVGLDGRSAVEKDGNLLHAFESNKMVPNWYRQFGDTFQEYQMIIFWDYIMELKKRYNPNLKVYNLGEGVEHNVLTDLFAESYPLPKDIKERLNGAH